LPTWLVLRQRSAVTIDEQPPHVGNVLVLATAQVGFVDGDEDAGAGRVEARKSGFTVRKCSVQHFDQCWILALFIVVKGLKRELRRCWIEQL